MVVTVDSTVNETISEEEAALYDRQIRLWGLEAQNRLKHSRILLQGVTPLSAEIAKNLVLAGIASMTIVDDRVATAEDVLNNFLIPHDAIGTTLASASVQRTQTLNPMVKVSATSSFLTDGLTSKLKDYDVIIVTTDSFKEDLSFWEAFDHSVSELTSPKPLLILAATLSCWGMAFLNLGNHEFVAEQITSKKLSGPTPTCVKSEENSKTATTFVKMVADYPSLEACLNLRWPSAKSEILPRHVPKGYFVMQVLRRCPSNTSPLTLQHLKSVWKDVAGTLNVDESLLTDEDFLCCCGSSSASVNAILGGVVSQEIVRAITGRGAPHGNWYFLNGLQCTTTVEWLPNSAISP
ncbi:hypothetical protein P879_07986 [Paragonimus westermani]|uniref:THIF-type NAD/FAD binding fold domain-containing protein n=1 Tax=Paragonimus westermani TaxID=34504 RepID=A0A8T0D1T3_9TREM|nr:hypothetical protein P879_07986 [Paragonimus westermani]